MKNKLTIGLTGEFYLEYKGKKLSVNGHQGEKMWKMLAHLLLNRERPVSAEEMYYVVEGAAPEGDPGRLMKNLLYRLRKMLDGLHYLQGNQMVLYDAGEYFWNPVIEPEVDLDLFWSWYDKAEEARGKAQKMRYYQNALKHYHGALLEDFVYYPWIQHQRDWLENAYLQARDYVLLTMEERGEWEDAEEIGRLLLANRKDSLFLEQHYLDALIKNGKLKEARVFAMEMQNRWEKDFCIRLADVIPNIYRDLDLEKHAIYMDLGILQQQITDENRQIGAFFADMSVFKSSYQLMLRMTDRYRWNVWLCQISLVNSPFAKSEDGYEQEKLWMETIFNRSLRKGDLVTGYCPGEYLMMVMVEREPNLGKIFRRLQANCKGDNPQIQLKLQYQRITKAVEEPIKQWMIENG